MIRLFSPHCRLWAAKAGFALLTLLFPGPGTVPATDSLSNCVLNGWTLNLYPDQFQFQFQTIRVQINEVSV